MTATLHKLCELRTKVNKPVDSWFVGKLLAVDPGETTGISLLDVHYDQIELMTQAQIPTWPLEGGAQQINTLFATFLPTFVVYEAYHVYSWRLEEHTFSEIPTIQIIGAFKYAAILRGIPYKRQTAQVGKAFFKDDLLRKLDMYYEGQPHARDSLRHAAQHIVFGTKDDEH
jgi:hypothetical protein